ncbi:hypothetical protein [Henriciella sp.]|uniref:hypothetical protein n=1 Tax=Henriciella sp. TaxID=1968823 RepID=UPI00261454D8|nr:hypothetical protein [Henriciella sp.]
MNDGKMTALLSSYRPANSLALSLFSMTEAVFPAEWNNEVSELFVRDLVSFSVHARRLVQNTSLKNEQLIVERPYHNPQYTRQVNWLDRFDFATNRIIHYVNLEVDYVETVQRQRFKGTTRNHAPFSVRVTTKDFPEKADINVNGMALVFLTNIKPFLQSSFPALAGIKE